MTDIPINLVFEDVLSEAVLKQMLKQSQRPFSVGQCLNQRGYGKIKKIISGLNYAAKGMPYLVLTDLDNAECPLVIISEWLTQPKHPNLLFRVAVKEVEAWLLAHRSAFADFLGISVDLIPGDADRIPDPKQLLINLAKKSRSEICGRRSSPSLIVRLKLVKTTMVNSSTLSMKVGRWRQHRLIRPVWNEL